MQAGGRGKACLEGPLEEVLVWSTAVHPETGSCHSFTQRPCPQSQSEALLPTFSMSRKILGIIGGGGSDAGEILEPAVLFQGSGGAALHPPLTARLKTPSWEGRAALPGVHSGGELWGCPRGNKSAVDLQTKDAVYTLSAMTSGIRRNWIEALRKTVRPTTAPDVTKYVLG